MSINIIAYVNKPTTGYNYKDNKTYGSIQTFRFQDVQRIDDLVLLTSDYI